MNFTYQDYEALLELLKEKGYTFCNYHNYEATPRCVVLRHDIDQSPAAALKMAEIEAEHGAISTYFLLLRTDFYNPASKSVQEQLRRIRELGHEIGLHFDEVAYGQTLSSEMVISNILKERDVLATLLDAPVSAVSMHRPSKATLESDLQIPGMINSYGKTFFHDFKYLSDSRRNWREPVLDIIRAGEYDRLHILTHAFWYHESEQSITETVRTFIRDAKMERYGQMKENISDLPAILEEHDI